MKYLGIILLSLACILTGCNQEHGHETFKWSGIDRKFDSIAQILDHYRLEMRPGVDSQMTALREAYALSPRRSDLEGRMLYREGDYMYRYRHDEDSAVKILRQALALTDSTLYPYDHARIKMDLSGKAHQTLYDIYRTIREVKSTFEFCGDSAMTALCEVETGNIFESIGYTRIAVESYRRAMALYEAAGLEYVIPRIKMNLSLTLYNSGRRDEADSLIRIVAADSLIRSSLALKHLAMMNKYYLTADTSCLLQSYAISSHFPFLLDMKATESVEIGKMFMDRNQPDSAAIYIRDAFRYYDRLSDLNDRKNLLDAMIRLEGRMGNLNEIPALYQRLSGVRDSIEEQRADQEIMSEETRYKIELLRHAEAEAESRHRMMTWILSLTGVILILLIVSGALTVRTRLLREKIEVEKRLVKARESLAALKVHQENTGAILEDVVTEVERLGNEPSAAGKTLQWLRNKISIHTAKSKEWNVILDSFQQIHPRFESRMMAAYPSLTKKQIEFAGFIALGMTTKQIAEILNIDVASVNTGRYRLRTKMGLQKGDSLLDAIMRHVN